MEFREEVFFRNLIFSIISIWVVFKVMGLDKITKEIIIIMKIIRKTRLRAVKLFTQDHMAMADQDSSLGPADHQACALHL